MRNFPPLIFAINSQPLHKTLIIFVQTALLVIGICSLTFLLIEPQFEGRNIGATFTQIYFQDPFLLYAYVSSTPFFVTLFHTFKVMSFAGKNALFTEQARASVRIIKYSALAMIPFIIGGVVWLLLMESDDLLPVVGIGVVGTVMCGAVLGVAGRVEGRLGQHP